MKKNIIFLMVIIFSCSFQVKNKSIQNSNNTAANDLFKVYKIDSINSFYFVYCTKNELNYKIISKKVNQKYKHIIIKENNSYSFKLKEFPDYSNNNNPLTGYSPIVDCFMLDEETEICKEKDIKDLYTTPNLIGLYYVR